MNRPAPASAPVAPLVALAAAAALVAGGTLPASGPAPAALVGSWGGPHVRLEAKESGSLLEYDCGNGTIEGPIVPDGRGRFDVKGSHSAEHGGPIRRDEAPRGRPARYVGRVTGDRMDLTVTLTDDGETLGTFQLVRGEEPRLFKCR